MRSITAILMLLISFSILSTSCNNAKKSLYSGDYDSSINKAVKKLRKKQVNEKYVLILEQAYNKANARDLEYIRRLKTEGSPHNWEKIYKLYADLVKRQEKIRPITPLYYPNNKKAHLPFGNYSQELATAKHKAAEYLYANANQLLSTNRKEQARLAYDKLNRLNRLYPNFRDTDRQLNKAKILGTNYVLLKIANHSGFPLPVSFANNLTSVNRNRLNDDWLDFHTNENPHYAYDYDVVINIQQVNITPESVKENNFSKVKEVEKGWEYVLDDKGNVRKDSLGNDIKIPKLVSVVCNIQEVIQRKETNIIGSVDYFNRNTRQLLGTYPIAANAEFRNHYAITDGNEKALTDELRDVAKNRPLPFPQNIDMVMDAGNSLKKAVNDVLCKRKDLVMR